MPQYKNIETVRELMAILDKEDPETRIAITTSDDLHPKDTLIYPEEGTGFYGEKVVIFVVEK